MTMVKICGITNKKDLQIATSAGADAVGFIVGVKSSPRNLSIKKANKLIRQVPLFVQSVVVTVPKNIDEVRRLHDTLHPNAIQIHGSLDIPDLSSIKKAFPNLFLIRALKVIPANIKKRAVSVSKNFDAILLDSYIKGKHGGTGVVHDWALSLKIKQLIHPIPMILAGGLKPENVVSAIDYVQPYAVDVSSGVEKQLGIKDKQKIYNFIKHAKDIKNEKN